MFRSSIILMGMTMLSRVLGLVRTMLIAFYFGATGMTDAYFSAFKISNFFRQLLGEGALGTVFIPIYNEAENENGFDNSKKLVYSILNLLFIFTTIISLLMIIFSQEIIQLIVGGYSPEIKLEASKLLKIMSFYLVFIGMSGMICAILNNFKQFLIPATTSLLFNIAIIISIVGFGYKDGVKAMAYGVLVGGFLQLAIVVPSFIKKFKGYSLKVDYKDPRIKQVFLLILPMLVGIFARQLNSIIDQFFASTLPSGGVSGLENATRLYNLPLGVFGISIATVVYPSLSRAAAKKDYKGVKDTLSLGINFLFFLIVPATFILFGYAKKIVELVLGHGKFSETASLITSESLQYYVIALFFYAGIHLLSRSFYSMKDTKTPVIFSMISISCNIVLNFLLVKTYKHKGLALATSIAAIINFVLLYIFFNIKHIKLSFQKNIRFFLLVIGSSVIGMVVSREVENVCWEILIFIVVYIGLWSYPLVKKKRRVFE